jgi:replication factor A1
VKDKYILVVLDLEILEQYGEPDKLGHPVAIESTKPEEQEDVKPQPGNIAGNGFYGNKPQAQPQQNQERSLASRPNNSGGSHGAIYPIEALSPYAHRWTIKARCTHKGDVKHWHNKNGDGKLFSVNFLDESGEIRATGFGEAVDSWYDVLQEGSVYYVSSPAKIQLAKKQFNNTNHDYEMTFEKDTMIEKAEDTDGVPKVTFNFRSLADLQNVEKDSTIDCIGVLKSVAEVSEVVSKTSGKPFSKRELELVDNTGFSVRLTIWGKTAESFEVPEGSVMAFKGVKVSDFGGRSLSLLSSGSMTVDPDIDEAHILKGWYDGSGRNEQFQSHATTVGLANATSGGDRGGYKTIAQVRDENIGMTDTAEWFSIKGTIVYIKHDKYCYPACRSENCNKSMPDTGDGIWNCQKCEATWDSPDYRYILTISVNDHTGQMYLNCFNDTGIQIMGTTANDLKKLEEDGDDRKVLDAFQDATCKTFIFRCKAKMDTYQDQQRYVWIVTLRVWRMFTDLLQQSTLPSIDRSSARLRV